ncbi:MAG TPA: hypothetical protein VFU50_11130 [Terriglobales bacterium]|nr:hypothetical protein [Terriglobales bacterium]
MKREEPRTGRIADFEFQFWECWESEGNVPGVAERHWFRSDTGLEAPTYDHMLQMLYRQKMGLLVAPGIATQPQASCTSEWDKRTSHTVRVRGEEVLITICEHYTEASAGAPVSTKVIGPNGLITSTYPEMLERLGVARENRPSALGPPQAERSAKQETPNGRTQILAGTNPDREKFALSLDGKLVPATEPASPGAEGDPAAEAKSSFPNSLINSPTTDPCAAPKPAPSEELHSAIRPAETGQPQPTETDRTNAAVALSPDGSSGDQDVCALDARDMEQANTRGEEFENRHPWLWDDPDQELEEPMNSMRLVWWGEYIKTVYPELAAAALDPEKYQAYIDNYDYDKPIPLNEPDEKARTADDAPRCQFIKADGQQCGSPALRRKRFCYFHSKTAEDRKRKNTTSAGSRAAARSPLEMPVLEDDLAIKMAVSNICRHLANERIDPKRAATLLYGIQVATVAVRRAGKGAILKW